MLIFKNSDNFKVYIQFALELLFSWVSLGTVAGGGFAGNPREEPSSRAGGTLQGWSCRGRPSTDALLWVSSSSGLGRGCCLHLLLPVQWLYLGTNRRLPVNDTPGVCAQRPLPSRSCSACLQKACFIWLLLLSSVSWSTNAASEGREGLGMCSPLSSLCSSLTWALCEISLWPPAERSQLLLDNVRTCLYLPTKTCLKHSYKQNFKFENLLWGIWFF